MKVVSLFDGMSCGMVALERAGVNVEAYYASEIDKNAIAISEKNYPNIIRLGDVNRWREWSIPLEERNEPLPSTEEPTLEVSDLAATFTGKFDAVKFMRWVSMLPMPDAQVRIRVEVTRV